MMKATSPATPQSTTDATPFPARQPLHAGGPVPPGACYLLRACDEQVVSGLLQGRSGHVQAPPGYGKSSLARRCVARLSEQGLPAVYIALGSLPEEGGAEGFYLALITQLSDALRRRDLLPAYGRESSLPRPLRLQQALRALTEAAPLSLLLDECEVLAGQPFAADVLRVLDAATRPTDGGRFSFCLLGTVTPADLGGAGALGGEAWPLGDLTFEEAAPLLQPFVGGAAIQPWLNGMLELTGGHPELTVRLAQAVLDEGLALGEVPAADVPAALEGLAAELLRDDAVREAPLCAHVARAFARPRPETGVMLDLYRRVLIQGDLPLDGEQDGVRALQQLGLIRISRAGERLVLSPRSRMMAQLFDATWVRRREDGRFLGGRMRAWEDAGRPSERLLLGDALGEALQWAEGREDITAAERAYLLASQQGAHTLERQAKEQAQMREVLREKEARQRELRTQRAILIGLFAVIAVLVAVIGYLTWDRGVARREQVAARAETERAQATLRETTAALSQSRTEHEATRARLKATEQTLAQLNQAAASVKEKLGQAEAQTREITGDVLALVKKRIVVKGRGGDNTGINEKAVNTVMLGQGWPALRKCFPLTGPLPERVRVELTVQPDGQVSEAQADIPAEDRPCAKTALTAARFPSFAGAHWVRVVYVFLHGHH